MVNLANHECLLKSNDIVSICSPLKILGINYFTLDRIYKDGSRNIYTNRADWIHYYYQNSYYENVNFNLEKLPPEFVLWSTLSRINTNDIYISASNFGIAHGITLVLKEELYIDFYNFGTTKDREEMEKWFTYNLDLLKRFIHYFKSVASKLIKHSEQSKIYLPTSNDFLIDDARDNIECSQEAEFLRATQLNKFYINDKVYLTKREIECAKKLIMGYSIKEMANELKLSSRTVEEHVDNIKNKTGSNVKSHVIKTLLKTDIHLVDT